MDFILTSETLVLVAGFALSFIFELVPKLNEWYAKQNGARKRGVMVLFTIATGAGVYGLGCAGFGWISPGFFVSCDASGLSALVQIVGLSVIALIANQTGFTLNPLATTESREKRFAQNEGE